MLGASPACRPRASHAHNRERRTRSVPLTSVSGDGGYVVSTTTPSTTPDATASGAMMTATELVESLTTVDSPYIENYRVTGAMLDAMTPSAIREYESVQAGIAAHVFGTLVPLTTNRAAYATIAGVRAGLLTGLDGKGESVYTSAQWLDRYGKEGESITLVTTWKGLGYALAVFGLDESDPLYLALRNSGAIGQGEVKDVLFREGATYAEVWNVVENYADMSTGKRLDKKQKAARMLVVRKAEAEARREAAEAEAARQAEAEAAQAAETAREVALTMNATEAEAEAIADNVLASKRAEAEAIRESARAEAEAMAAEAEAARVAAEAAEAAPESAPETEAEVTETEAEAEAEVTTGDTLTGKPLAAYVSVSGADWREAASRLDREAWEAEETAMREFLDSENTRRATEAAAPRPRGRGRKAGA